MVKKRVYPFSAMAVDGFKTFLFSSTANDCEAHSFTAKHVPSKYHLFEPTHNTPVFLLPSTVIRESLFNQLMLPVITITE